MSIGQANGLGRARLPPCLSGAYFNTNIAFTCAVTVTFWGENSSVGAGPCAAMAAGNTPQG